MTDDSTDHMTAKYKMAIITCVVRCILESDKKPQNALKMDLHLTCA